VVLFTAIKRYNKHLKGSEESSFCITFRTGETCKINSVNGFFLNNMAFKATEKSNRLLHQLMTLMVDFLTMVSETIERLLICTKLPVLLQDFEWLMVNLYFRYDA
jgi:hypothetical protein